MEDVNNGIRRIAEELQAVREQLTHAGLLADDAPGHVHRWELARRIGSLFERLQTYFYLHQQNASAYRQATRQAPRPD